MSHWAPLEQGVYDSLELVDSGFRAWGVVAVQRTGPAILDLRAFIPFTARRYPISADVEARGSSSLSALKAKICELIDKHPERWDEGPDWPAARDLKAEIAAAASFDELVAVGPFDTLDWTYKPQLVDGRAK